MDYRETHHNSRHRVLTNDCRGYLFSIIAMHVKSGETYFVLRRGNKLTGRVDLVTLLNPN